MCFKGVNISFRWSCKLLLLLLLSRFFFSVLYDVTANWVLGFRKWFFCLFENSSWGKCNYVLSWYNSAGIWNGMIYKWLTIITVKLQQTASCFSNVNCQNYYNLSNITFWNSNDHVFRLDLRSFLKTSKLLQYDHPPSVTMDSSRDKTSARALLMLECIVFQA